MYVVFRARIRSFEALKLKPQLIRMLKSKQITALVMTLLPLVIFARQQPVYTVAGTVKDKKTGETLSGASIGFLQKEKLGVVTNAYGFYSISLPKGQYTMIISFSGYAIDTVQLDLQQNIVMNRSLWVSNGQLQQVVVSGRKATSILKTPPGLQKMSIEEIKSIPVLLGEKDILKTIQLETGSLAAAPAEGACDWCDFRLVCGPNEEQRTGRKPKDRLRDLIELRIRP
jgi:hypothetical protein